MEERDEEFEETKRKATDYMIKEFSGEKEPSVEFEQAMRDYTHGLSNRVYKIAENMAKKLGINFEENKENLINASGLGCMKLWEMGLEGRSLYGEFNKEEMREITGATIKEYLLNKEILPEERTEETLEDMLEYPEAFEKELEFYDIVEEDGEIVGYGIKDHDFFDCLSQYCPE